MRLGSMTGRPHSLGTLGLVRRYLGRRGLTIETAISHIGLYKEYIYIYTSIYTYIYIHMVAALQPLLPAPHLWCGAGSIEMRNYSGITKEFKRG